MTDIKQYRREYYRQKYRTDLVYKKLKKEINRQRYVRKTKNCEDCGSRISKDIEDTICEACKMKDEVQIKSKRGRPRKVKPEEVAIPEEAEHSEAED